MISVFKNDKIIHFVRVILLNLWAWKNISKKKQVHNRHNGYIESIGRIIVLVYIWIFIPVALGLKNKKASISLTSIKRSTSISTCILLTHMKINQINKRIHLNFFFNLILENGHICVQNWK